MVLMAQPSLTVIRWLMVRGTGRAARSQIVRGNALLRSRSSRYSELLLSELAGTPNRVPNFDGTLQEPKR
ncbi:hypothetical protein ACNKHU_18635 [Shigella flexneri]